MFNAQGAANEKIKLYVNGVQKSSGTHPSTAVGAGVSPLWIGDLDSARNFPWDGVLDEIGIWNIALTEAEIRQVMLEEQNEDAPRRRRLESDAGRWLGRCAHHTDLAWAPGEYAAAHNVYFGPSRDEVKRRTPAALVAEGLDLDVNQSGCRTPGLRPDVLLAGRRGQRGPGQNGLRRPVWSFTTEPFAYPITA